MLLEAATSISILIPSDLAQFKCARPNSTVCFSNEQITYKYGYFNKNLYFAKHNNC